MLHCGLFQSFLLISHIEISAFNRGNLLIPLKLLLRGFTVYYSHSGKSPSVRMDLYKSASLFKKDYFIPSKPGRPELKGEPTHEALEVEWTAPKRGMDNLKEYEVLIFDRVFKLLRARETAIVKIRGL